MSAVYRIGYLQRVPLRTPYPAIVGYVGGLLGKLPRDTELVLDFTGVGRPVFDMFHYAGISPVGVLITGGAHTQWDGSQIAAVPKVTLISHLIALLHSGRLKCHKELPEGRVLAEELRNFRASYTDAGHLTFSARQGKHDDLLLATGLAAWYLEGAGRPSQGVWDYYCRRDAAPERYCVGVDLGQSADPTAICVMSRVELNPADPAEAAFEAVA